LVQPTAVQIPSSPLIFNNQLDKDARRLLLLGIPFSLFSKNDFPLPHLANMPTIMGIVRKGSLKVSAIAVPYKS
jgi:hypothetical protein